MNMIEACVKYNGNYYHESDSLSLLGVDIKCCGYQQINPFDAYPPKKHPRSYYFDSRVGRVLDDYQVIYIVDGTGVLVLKGVKYRVSKGDLIYLVPGEWHTYYPDEGSGWSEYFIGFSGSAIERHVENDFLAGFSQKKFIGLNIELVSLFKGVIDMAACDDNVSKLKLFGLVSHILGLVIYESANRIIERNKNAEVVESAKLIMNNHVDGFISPEEVAFKLDISYSLFRKLFKKLTGFGPAHYFMLLKVQKAKHYLTETEMSVKEIAYTLKFNSLESFIIAFKRTTHETPTQYRNSCRINSSEN